MSPWEAGALILSHVSENLLLRFLGRSRGRSFVMLIFLGSSCNLLWKMRSVVLFVNTVSAHVKINRF